MIDNKFERCAPDDPDRCQGVTASGQCPYKRTPESKYCHMHCGPRNESVLEKEKIRNYRATMYQQRINEFADNEKVKSLREEVGILRLTLENILERSNDPNLLYMNTHKIRDLVKEIKEVVVACHRLEESTGQLLDKNAALNFAGRIVEIVSMHVQDAKVLHNIGNEIILAITKKNDDT